MKKAGLLLFLLCARAQARPSLASILKQEWWTFGGDQFRLLAVVDTGSQPKGVTVTPDGKHVVVTNFGQHDSSNVYRYEPATLAITARAEFPGNSVEVLPRADSSLVYVSNFYHQQLLALDPATMQVRRAYQTGKVPKHFALSPDGKRAYVANWEGASISAVDLEHNVLAGTVKVGYQPRGTAITHDGKKVYVTNTGAHTLSVIDTATLQATTRPFCKFPRHATTTPGGLILISCLGTHYVMAIDPATDQVVHKVAVGAGPKTLEASPDGRFAYTADYRGDTMSMIDLTTWESLVVPLPLARGSGLAVSPDHRRIYVTGWDSETMIVIERLPAGEAAAPAPSFATGFDLQMYKKPEQHPDKTYQQRLESYKKRLAQRRKNKKKS